MDGPDRLVTVGHALAQGLDEVAIQLGHGVTHCVGYVDGGSPLFDDGLDGPGIEVVGLGVVVGRGGDDDEALD